VLVPFPFAVDDHQTANARFLEQGGAAWLFSRRIELPNGWRRCCENGWATAPGYCSMAEAARRLAKVEAAEQVARACLEQARTDKNIDDSSTWINLYWRPSRKPGATCAGFAMCILSASAALA
jgi:hypothetical protein